MRPTSKLSPDTTSISALIAEIANGEIKVPQFQRGYVWSPQQALNLLDSISNNYPMGSILLWRTSEELPAARNIGNFQLPAIDATEPTDHVLDGHQRLTVIYSCLGASLQDGGFSAGYDLEKQKYVELQPEEDSPQQNFFAELTSHIVPLQLLFTGSDILDFRAKLQLHVNSDVLQKRLIVLMQAFEHYKIPVIT